MVGGHGLVDGPALFQMQSSWFLALRHWLCQPPLCTEPRFPPQSANFHKEGLTFSCLTTCRQDPWPGHKCLLVLSGREHS